MGAVANGKVPGGKGRHRYGEREGGKERKEKGEEKKKKKKKKKGRRREGEKGDGAAGDRKRWVLGFVFEWMVKMKGLDVFSKNGYKWAEKFGSLKIHLYLSVSFNLIYQI